MSNTTNSSSTVVISVIPNNQTVKSVNQGSAKPLAPDQLKCNILKARKDDEERKATTAAGLKAPLTVNLEHALGAGSSHKLVNGYVATASRPRRKLIIAAFTFLFFPMWYRDSLASSSTNGLDGSKHCNNYLGPTSNSKNTHVDSASYVAVVRLSSPIFARYPSA